MPDRRNKSSLRVGSLNVGQGFARKLGDVIQFCVEERIDLLCLQEIGDPQVGLERVCDSAGFRLVQCGKSGAGVALLVAKAVAPYIRKTLHSEADGRLVACVFDFGSHTLAVVSAYMPTGLDAATEESSSLELARELHARIEEWAHGASMAFVGGDFNEAMTAQDRTGGRGRCGRLVSVLCGDAWIDAYRARHPQPDVARDFTHEMKVVGGEVSRSRIDYIFVRSAHPRPVVACEVQDFGLSHHRWLVATVDIEARITIISSCRSRPRLPRVKDSSEEQQAHFARLLTTRLASLEELLAHGDYDRERLDRAATLLCSSAFAAAKDAFGLTGGRPLESAKTKALFRLRRGLSRLLRVGERLHGEGVVFEEDSRWAAVSRPAMAHARRLCGPALNPSTREGWFTLRDTLGAEIRELRRSWKWERRQMRLCARPRWQVNTTAAIHEMLRGGRPASLDSAVDPESDKLIVDPSKLKEVLRAHFAKTFALPPADASSPPPAAGWAEEMFRPRADVCSEWYVGLMQPVGESELLRTLKDCKLVSAPGEDGVSAGLWRLACERSGSVLTHVTGILNACLRLRCLPAVGKKSVIVPILKKIREEPTMANLRPISLQCALTKLLSKVLARRLGEIFARNPILHPSQQGFVVGGSTLKCVDQLLDALETSRAEGTPFYAAFYDIAAAYDSVQAPDLARALRRLVLPEPFIELVLDSMTGLRSSVRTAYGLSAEFDVLRSVRQGDPLSPLLYIILMDALHWGLAKNPMYPEEVKDGREEVKDDRELPALTSLGYADDTVAAAKSCAQIVRQNEFVESFCKLNHQELNGRKTAFLAVAEDGKTCAPLRVCGHDVPPVEQDGALTYLGVQVCPAARSRHQYKRLSSTVGLYCHLAGKHKLGLQQLVRFFNSYLIPKVEQQLRYVKASEKDLKKLDKKIAAVFGRRMEAARRPKAEALACTTGLLLPSSQRKVLEVGEAFLRLNDPSAAAASARARWESRDGSAADNRLVAASRTAAALGFELQRVHHRTSLPVGLVPLGVSVSRTLVRGQRVPVVMSYFGAWGTEIPTLQVSLYTDGSRQPRLDACRSAWAVCLGDDSFEAAVGVMPLESNMRERDVEALAVWSGDASAALGGDIFLVELEAILRALHALPFTFFLKLFVDSKSALQAIETYAKEFSERRKLRMHGRPVLALIQRAIRWRRDAGGSVEFVHVKAHSDAADQHSVGNRVADFAAQQECKRRDPRRFGELPVSDGEAWVVLRDQEHRVVAADVRKALRGRAEELNLEVWQQSPSQRRFASEVVVRFCGELFPVLNERDGALLVATVTDTRHFERRRDDNGAWLYEERNCQRCPDQMASVKHRVFCPGGLADRRAAAAVLRQELRGFDVNSRLRLMPLDLPLEGLLSELLQVPRCASRHLFGAFGVAEAAVVASALGCAGGGVGKLSNVLREVCWGWYVAHCG